MPEITQHTNSDVRAYVHVSLNLHFVPLSIQLVILKVGFLDTLFVLATR